MASVFTARETFRIQEDINRAVDDLLSLLPQPSDLSPTERRGIIARYTAVLEGNFIYWMTGTYLSVHSENARSIILENLHEEVRDSHPAMLRRFAMAAHSFPTATDALAISEPLLDVRLFVGRLSGVKLLVMMAFFENFIQRFMPYLAELARMQGSTEQEYTDVHGVCDITHTQQLYEALEAEIAFMPPASADLFEGVGVLTALIHKVMIP
jgi:hypothetical protein